MLSGSEIDLGIGKVEDLVLKCGEGGVQLLRTCVRHSDLLFVFSEGLARFGMEIYCAVAGGASDRVVDGRHLEIRFAGEARLVVESCLDAGSWLETHCGRMVSNSPDIDQSPCLTKLNKNVQIPKIMVYRRSVR